MNTVRIEVRGLLGYSIVPNRAARAIAVRVGPGVHLPVRGAPCSEGRRRPKPQPGCLPHIGCRASRDVLSRFQTGESHGHSRAIGNRETAFGNRATRQRRTHSNEKRIGKRSPSSRTRTNVVLSGDIGNRLFDDSQRQVPDRCFTAASPGEYVAWRRNGEAVTPVCYTITRHHTCMEQIRVMLLSHVPVVMWNGRGTFLRSLAELIRARDGHVALLPGWLVEPADAWMRERSSRVEFFAHGYIRIGTRANSHTRTKRIARSQSHPSAREREVAVDAVTCARCLETDDLLARKRFREVVVFTRSSAGRGTLANASQFQTFVTIEETAAGGWVQRGEACGIIRRPRRADPLWPADDSCTKPANRGGGEQFV